MIHLIAALQFLLLLRHEDDIAVLSSFAIRSPLNEDVFAARPQDDIPVTHEEIKDLQAKIYKLFLQVIILLNTKHEILLIFKVRHTSFSSAFTPL